MMMAFIPLEFVVTPDTTYILIGMYDHFRRIYTDGRDWPANIEPSFQGYSIGKWIDEDGDGTYDVLEVETRGFKDLAPTTTRPAAARRQSVRLQGAHLSRQGRSKHHA